MQKNGREDTIPLSSSVVRHRTLTDRISSACQRALEQRRPMIDAQPDGLSSVGLIVSLDRRGHILKVLVRSESCDEATT